MHADTIMYNIWQRFFHNKKMEKLFYEGVTGKGEMCLTHCMNWAVLNAVAHPSSQFLYVRWKWATSSFVPNFNSYLIRFGYSRAVPNIYSTLKVFSSKFEWQWQSRRSYQLKQSRYKQQYRLRMENGEFDPSQNQTSQPIEIKRGM